MNTIQDQRLRKVAILVASLDETSSERVLAGLSPAQARSVRQQVAQLTEIDPDEQRDIVAEFRRSLLRPLEEDSDGVELDASLQERIDHDDYTPEATYEQSPFDAISTSEAEFLVEMLGSESSQTVAVVLSRLDTDRAAEVLSHFSPARQTEILERLGELDTADEQSVRVVETQIAQWIAAQRRRKERMNAGREMVERIMSRTTIPRSGTEADKVIIGTVPNSLKTTASNFRPSSLPRKHTALPQQVRYEPSPRIAEGVSAPQPFAHLTASECQTALEDLPAATLLAALTHSESHVVSLALVGVSEKLMKRVLRGLSRREAQQFRRQLRELGPTRISDILAAQQELLGTATRLDEK